MLLGTLLTVTECAQCNVAVAERAAINQRQIRSLSDVCISIYILLLRTRHSFLSTNQIDQSELCYGDECQHWPISHKNMAASMIEYSTDSGKAKGLIKS